jgi:superfamily II helicase
MYAFGENNLHYIDPMANSVVRGQYKQWLEVIQASQTRGYPTLAEGQQLCDSELDLTCLHTQHREKYHGRYVCTCCHQKLLDSNVLSRKYLNISSFQKHLLA